jgi:primosomal protein N' (replication factor Y) (superfamily II helicase)
VSCIAQVEPMTTARALRGPFDYRLPEELRGGAVEVGSMLVVPFGRREVLGVVVGLADSSDVAGEKLLAPLRALELGVPAEMVALAEWIAAEYCSTLARALGLVLPPGAARRLSGRKRRAVKRSVRLAVGVRSPEPPAPSEEQRAVLDVVQRALGDRVAHARLLHGVTGSGKTEIYLRAAETALAQGRGAIVLVPEIALTPQTAARFTAVFGERVAVVHSALSERERFDAWQAAARGELDVVVGARSAIFAPLPDVRLIVVDEEHESSYRQDTVPRYHAVEVARERMRRAGGVVVLGSATPALDDYARARAGRFPLVALRYRATAQPLPETHVVDMAREFEAGSRHVFASSLVEAIGERLRRGEKTVLFVNRRGAARFVLCRACGAVPGCTRCSTGLVLHREEGLLRCHYCDAQRPVPQQCPACGDGPVLPFGVGTQRVVEDLAQLYPAARIVRMDSDSTTRIGDHARLLERFGRDGDVLVGTQMVAKGLDFPEVTLVGVLAADADLHVADYRAAERTFDVIVQVCGRSGRAREGEAIVQTYAPEHPAIACAARHDYETFARLELAERRAARWPPFVHLAFVGAIGRDRTAAQAAIERYAGVLRDDPRWDVLGPAPYPIERLNDEWRYRIAIKTRDLAPLRAALRAHVLPLAAREKRSRLAVVFEG